MIDLIQVPFSCERSLISTAARHRLWEFSDVRRRRWGLKILGIESSLGDDGKRIFIQGFITVSFNH